jgi:transcriptional regulator with GAF, ATPase, and Fis domain
MVQIGTVVGGRYELRERIGSGELASTFVAHDTVGNDTVVLKVAHGGRDGTLLREHAALRAVRHESLARVRGLGWLRDRATPRPYYVAERVDGPTLDAWVASCDSFESIRSALIDVTRALAALHRAGLRHGDVKPDNVRVRDDGRAVLLDLSCVVPIDEARRGQISGTAGFLAPELLRGEHVDVRADLFALGATIRALRIPRLDRLADRLCAESPDMRPANADEVLDLLGAHPETTLAPIAEAMLLGRDRELAMLDALIDRLERREPGPRTLSWSGPRGSGITRLLDELEWRAQRTIDTTRANLRSAAPIADLVSRARAGRVLPSLVAIERALSELASRDEPMLLVIDALEPRWCDGVQQLLSCIREDGALGVICAHPSGVPLAPLTEPDVARWIDSVGASHVDASLLTTLCEGRPASIAARLEHAMRGDDWRVPPSIAFPKDAPLEMRVLVTGASKVPGGLSPRDARALGVRDRTLDEALARGWVVIEDGALRSRYVLENAGAEAQERLLTSGLLDVPACASLRVELGQLDIARASFDAAWWRAPRRWTRIAEQLMTHDAGEEDALRLARVALRAGDAKRAERALEHVGHNVKAQRVRAEHALKTGRIEKVRELLGDDRDPEALDLLSRALLASARYREAEVLAREAVSQTHDLALLARLRETEGLARGYSGQDGEESLRLASDAHRTGDDPAGLARVAASRGILAHRRGAYGDAVAAHREALAWVESHGIDDALGLTWLNLGCALQDDGDWGSAIDAYERGLRYATILGQEGTVASLRFNLANLLLEIGAFERAAELEERATRDVATLGFSHLEVPLLRLRAERALWNGDLGTAHAQLDRAERAPGAESERTELVRIRAYAWLAASRIDDAVRLLPSVESPVLRGEIELARGAALEAIGLAEGVLGAAGGRVMRARAYSLLSRAAAARGGAELAAAHRNSANAEWQRIALGLHPSLVPAFEAHPERRILRGEPRRDASSNRPRSDHDGSRFRRFLEINRRLLSSLDVREVLERAMDAAIELTHAERGFLLLTDDSGLHVAAARNLDREHVAEAHLKFSRSIAERVIETEEAVVTVDARTDERFTTGRSVHAMRLQSVACLPIRSQRGVRGALYLDNRFERGRFDTEDVETLEAFADQVAIALRNAELHAALEARTQALDEARAALEVRVAGQSRAIADLTSEVQRRQRLLEYRYDYSRIVGRGAAMRRVLDTLERVIESDLPIFIRGESGTGKELIAKAVHFNGPRRDAPMVSLNCAALPPALIESELFGHVRGAFTSADRDKPGLIAEADGGTLLLDEIGEMPMAAQAKLLRVLQEREVRPVGGSRTRKVDVRVIAATHRDPAAAIAAGTFREDLYYRIGVLTIELPPLRDREDDIPALADAFLAELGPKKRLTEDALSALRAHRWPGNVRELHNVIARACALSMSDRIDREDLGLAITTPSEPPRDRHDFEMSEQERIRRALDASRWNVSRVARELGIPRQTLYRKMQRYGLHAPGGHRL